MGVGSTVSDESRACAYSEPPHDPSDVEVSSRPYVNISCPTCLTAMIPEGLLWRYKPGAINQVYCPMCRPEVPHDLTDVESGGKMIYGKIGDRIHIGAMTYTISTKAEGLCLIA